MSRELSNLTDTEELRSIYMAENAINGYLSGLLVEKQLSSITDLNLREIAFINLIHFPDESKEIFKQFINTNER